MATPANVRFNGATAIYGGRSAPAATTMQFAVGGPAGAWSGTLSSGQIQAPAAVANPYRNAKTYLFQPSPAPVVDPALGGTFDYDSATQAGFGPTYTRVDNRAHWAWDNAGGDWIDASGMRQGSTHMASFAATAVTGSSTPNRYTGQNVTTLVQRAQTGDRWLAVRVGVSGSARAIAGPLHAQPPVINVTYTDGTTDALACVILARNNSGTSIPSTRAQTQSLPAFIEFERPAKPVVSATLDITVTEHWSGSSTLTFNLCDPPLNTDPVTGGLASAYTLDSGITGHADVLGAHRYIDGAPLSDFVHPTAINWGGEPQYSPEFWGGSVDNTKLPYVGAGKFISAGTTSAGASLSLVASSYTGEGFEPLFPGMGALRAYMPDEGTGPGQTWGEFGTTAVNHKIFMPPADFGVIDRVFVRYYVRLGTPHVRSQSDRFQVNKNGTPTWVDFGGKWGISPAHFGHRGVSGGSGGGNGWQMRHGWSELEDVLGGPAEGGVNAGWHLFDFGNANPVGHRYQSNAFPENWGQRGGLGSTLYAGRWYCIEVEVDANSVDQASGAGDGKNWTADGVLRAWIDGRLAYQRTGMVFRTLPKEAPAYNANQTRPVRDLGITELWWNWFHGGLSPSSVARTMFVTGLVWGRSRIGPMAGPQIQISGSTWTPNVDGDGNVLATDYAQLPLDTWLYVNTNKIDDLVPPGLHPAGSRYGTTVSGADGLPSVTNAWSGAAWDWINGRMYISGGGHADSWGTENGVFKFDAATMRFSVAVPRSAYAAAQWRDPGGPPAQPYQNATAQYVAGTDPAGNNGPQTDGAPPAMHTYDAIKWLPPGTIGNNTNGYYLIYAPGPSLHIANLDTGAYLPAWFKFIAPRPAAFKDFSYATAFTEWPYMWSPGITSTQNFGGETFRLDQTESTDWAANSQGLRLGNYSSPFVGYTHVAKCYMHPRRELAIIGWNPYTLVVNCYRYRLGNIADAGGAALTNWSGYVDTITLTGDTGDFTEANFREWGGSQTLTGSLYAAGFAYDEQADALWLCSNLQGGFIYKLTGLNTNTWNVTRYTASPCLTKSAPGTGPGGNNGTYGRFQVFTRGGATFAMRVVETTKFAEIRRLA